jgi:hypothetical protein
MPNKQKDMENLRGEIILKRTEEILQTVYGLQLSDDDIYYYRGLPGALQKTFPSVDPYNYERIICLAVDKLLMEQRDPLSAKIRSSKIINSVEFYYLIRLADEIYHAEIIQSCNDDYKDFAPDLVIPSFLNSRDDKA